MFVPTVNNTAKTAAEVTFEEWICKFGFLVTIQSDHGKHFASQVFDEMCKLNGIEHRMGSVGHAQSQGQVERQNQLLNQVRALCNNNIDTWPKAIIRVGHAHNIASNETTQVSPHQALFVQAPRTPESIAMMAPEQREMILQNTNNAVLTTKNQETKEKLKNLLIQNCRDNILAYQDNLAARQDTTVVPYSVGDRVRMKLNDDEKKKMGGKKIAPRNTVEYLVIRVIRGWTYELVKFTEKNLPKAKIKTRHFNELVPSNNQSADDGTKECFWVLKKSKEVVKAAEGSVEGLVEDPAKDPAENPAERQQASETVPQRYPKRERKPPNRLDVNSWRTKDYDDVTSSHKESDEDEEAFESGDSNSQ